jgi:hypothetical protein
MSLLEECAADCPYCGEPITLLIDTSCEEQSYVEDCEVCCRPIVVNVFVDEDGQVGFSLNREDD